MDNCKKRTINVLMGAINRVLEEENIPKDDLAILVFCDEKTDYENQIEKILDSLREIDLDKDI